MIFICDNLLTITKKDEEGKEDKGKEKIRRFLRIAIELPIELQMLLMNRTQGSSSIFIPLSERETALKSLALEFAFQLKTC